MGSETLVDDYDEDEIDEIEDPIPDLLDRCVLTTWLSIYQGCLLFQLGLHQGEIINGLEIRVRFECFSCS